MMIGVDHNHTIELMQQQPPLPPHSVNHLQSSTTDPSSSSIYDNNHHLHLTQTTTNRSVLSRIRLGLRCLCSWNDKQQQPFEHIFSSNEQTTNISERILDEYVPRLTNNAHSSLIVLCGPAREVGKLHTVLVSSTLTRLFHFVNDHHSSKKNFLLRLTAQELSSETFDSLHPTKAGFEHNVSCLVQSSQFLDRFCSEYRHLPLVISFNLILRSSNTIIAQLHILSTNDTNDDVDSQEHIGNFLLSMGQKQTFHLSNKCNSREQQTTCLTSLLHEFITDEHKKFLYILSTIKTDTQLRFWSNLQRLFKGKTTPRLKMSREKSDVMGDSSSVETVVNRHGDEIWVDGPYSTKPRSPKNEIWIDGPREFYSFSPTMRQKSTPKHRSTHPHHAKPMHTKPKPSAVESPCTILSPKHTLSPYVSAKMSHSRGNNDASSSSAACDTESVVSSHCHLPVLPVFRDHSLLPFRLPINTPTSPPPELISQTLPRKTTITNLTPKHEPPSSLTLSTNELNDGMEMLERTLETLLVPSPLVPSTSNSESIMTKSLNRIDELSALMSNDEKSKRLSRIVSPTRFDKLLVHNESPLTSTNVTPAHVPWCNRPTALFAGSSVPNSPVIISKSRHSRPLTSTSQTPQLAPRSPFINSRSSSSSKHPAVPSKKPKAPVRTTSLAENSRPPTTRLSILQRLFGLRSSSNNPPSIPAVIVPSSPSTPVHNPLISPLTVTLDSHDDLMPLTTSSTASSASGRASSSGYESMSNTILEEMIASTSTTLTGVNNNSIKVRSKSIRKDERRSDSNNTLWNSPLIRDKSRQQRVLQLKHRQNELKLELAMTKTFLLMDKHRHFDHGDSGNQTMAQSPLSATIPLVNDYDEEDEIERDIEHLERRLTLAKCNLLSTQRNPRMNIETTK